MIVDASAVIAILRSESDAVRCARTIAEAAELRMSAANWLEAAVVIDSSDDPVASRRFDELISVAGIQIEPVTERQAGIARQAYRDFGKGSGHPARLNFGDCFAYALAQDKRDSLVFVGKDFSQTDVVIASESMENRLA